MGDDGGSGEGECGPSSVNNECLGYTKLDYSINYIFWQFKNNYVGDLKSSIFTAIKSSLTRKCCMTFASLPVKPVILVPSIEPKVDSGTLSLIWTALSYDSYHLPTREVRKNVPRLQRVK
jgi:hypothetical protein